MAYESPDLIAQRMRATRGDMTDKLTRMEAKVTSAFEWTRDSARETAELVQGTVASATDSVQSLVSNTFDRAAAALDLPEHVRTHPWTALGISAVAGLATGWLTTRVRGAATNGTPASAFVPQTEVRQERPATPAGPDWLQDLVATAGVEVRRVGETAIRTASAALQASVQETVPSLIESAVAATTQFIQPEPAHAAAEDQATCDRPATSRF